LCRTAAVTRGGSVSEPTEDVQRYILRLPAHDDDMKVYGIAIQQDPMYRKRLLATLTPKGVKLVDDLQQIIGGSAAFGLTLAGTAGVIIVRALIACLALLLSMPCTVAAQSFPTKPLHIIVPLPPGAHRM
jgi:hypothetical protein